MKLTKSILDPSVIFVGDYMAILFFVISRVMDVRVRWSLMRWKA